MKFGIHSGLWMARWTDEIAPIFGTVADLGFDGVEVSLLGMTDEKSNALGGLAKDHGLEVTCSDGLAREADITSPDPEVRAAGLEYLRWAVRTTAAMGSRGLAGVVYAPWGVFDPPNRAERAKRAAEAFAALDADLERHDVTLGIEAINRFETDLVNTAAEASALAADSGSSRVGVLLDTFHMNMEEKDIAAAIVSARDHLVHFHVSDNDRGVPGSGHVPWPEGQPRPVRNRLRPVDRGGNVRRRRQPGERRPEHLAGHRAQRDPRGGRDAAIHARHLWMSAAFFTSLAQHFRDLEQPLNALDASIGDGDHGTAMRRGLEAVATADPGTAAQAFRNAAGGASGALFAALIGAIESVLAGSQDLPSALSRAATQVSKLGMAKRGDKTMLDALIPAAEAAGGASGGEAAQAAADASRAGAAATADMTARRGRARYVENGGVGHRDAGARSVAEILSEYATFSKVGR